MICPRSLTGAAALRVVAAVLLCKNDRTESVRRTSDLMANDPVFRVDAAAVVSDIIAGEAVMLHRVSGDYFSTDGVGCLIWEWIGENRSRDWILKTLNERFAGPPTE